MNFDNTDSLHKVADKLVNSTDDLLRTVKTEEDLKIGFEKLLEPISKSIGVTLHPKYEKSILGGRSDALHGQIIIEYESPNSLKQKNRVEHTFNQLTDYIIGEALERKETLFIYDPKLIGIGFDGETIFFVQYKGDKTKEKTELDKNDFNIIGPYPFTTESARTFLTYLRALSRLPLTAENLAEKFGPQSKIAPQSVSAFTDALLNWGDEKVNVFFNEWKRLFGIVYGEKFSPHQAEEAKTLARLYNVREEINFQELLFSVHTYFALLMKFIAAEIITLKESEFSSSYTLKLTHTSRDELKNQLHNIEDGGVYAKRGITNFLEGDFFCWYLNALSPRLEVSIREIARSISEFEPATTIIKPEATRDLLKKLYQYLVPKEVRHRLGEYYTPDWLAEFIINEVNYDGNTGKRLLDPACGSGTFIVLAIQKAKQFGLNRKEKPVSTAKKIISNIWGFDLNPLAVIAARTNYIFALGELIHEFDNLEIPIYLADSVLWPEQYGQMNLRPNGESVEITTSVETFFVPKIWIKNKGFLMRFAAPLVEKMAKERYSTSEAIDHLKKEGLVFIPHEDIVENFYNQILELEKRGKNGIWARFLKNAFAPMIAGKFDYVVGNPPWIRWGYLSQEYRKATLPLWKNYKLFSLAGHAARLGGGEKDFSMLFIYASIDYYLKKNATLGFLITQEVFKSKGAGEGFRRFRLGDNDKFKVLKAHDFVSVQPFEGAANKTAAIVVKRGKETTYPVPYTIWNRKKGTGKIHTDITLKDALQLLQKKKMIAQPIGNKTESWQTISEKQNDIGILKGINEYRAYLGARVEPYGVFWLEIVQVLFDNNLIIRNLPEKGKRKIYKVEDTIESDLIFPSVSGKDIERWYAKPNVYILLCQDPEKREPHPENIMKKKWPRTFGYLVKFKDILLTRGSKTVRQFAEKTEFYAMYGIGPYTIARYKVIWKRMANDIVAAVISQHKTPFGYKKIISTDTTSLFALNNENEAHYLCAIINSVPVREFIKSFSSAGRGFGSPSIMSHIGIQKFDSENVLHMKLSQLSKTLHNLKEKNELDKINKFENEVDDCVYELFGINK